MGPGVFRRAEIQHRKDNHRRWRTYIKPFVTVRNSESMAAGVNFLKNASVPWDLTCDELIFCQEGNFRLLCDGESYTIGPGDTMLDPVWLKGLTRKEQG